MRDWNPDLVIAMQGRDGEFKAYLWGIETATSKGYRDNLVQFKAYLWGIETVFAVEDTPADFKFKAYLWGIETTYPRVNCHLWVHLKPTYEGLKLPSQNTNPHCVG